MWLVAREGWRTAPPATQNGAEPLEAGPKVETIPPQFPRPSQRTKARPSLGVYGHQKIARFQKGLAGGGLTGIRLGRPTLGLRRAKVSGRFAWRDLVWRRKILVDQSVDPKARFASSIPLWAASSPKVSLFG